MEVTEQAVVFSVGCSSWSSQRRPLLVLQLVYTGGLVLCYLVYFVRFVGSEEANRKGFPIKTVGELLPRSAPGEVGPASIVIHIHQGTTSMVVVPRGPSLTPSGS